MISKGAKKILTLLRREGYRVRLEYEFDDLRGKKGVPLRFDFAILDAAAAVKALIEYDGEGHFERNKHFYKHLADFRKACERDRVKNKYCLMHNIPLYRIPYFDIDNITKATDLFVDKYRVKNKFHNDRLKTP